MAYTFDQIFAADPATPGNVAANAFVLIFAPGDATKTPLTITKPDGSPLANPVPVNANGFGSAFMHATLDRVAWEGGGFTDFFTSYEGMKEEAVSARSAADTAAANAATTAASLATGAVHFIVSATAPTETVTADGKPVVWIDTSGTTSSDTTAPSALAGLTAGTPTETTVPLSWTAATDDVGVTGYEYSLNGTTWTSTGSTGTTYTVTGLTQGTAYTIQVRAFDAAGNRGTSASVTATTAASADTTAPTAPTNLAGTAGQTTMDLSWTASTDAVGVTGYRVSKDNGATWITSAVTGTTYQVTGLTAGTSYTFAVAARDAAGNWSTNATLVKSTTSGLAPGDTITSDSFTGADVASISGRTTDAALGGTGKAWAVDAGTTLGITANKLAPAATVPAANTIRLPFGVASQDIEVSYILGGALPSANVEVLFRAGTTIIAILRVGSTSKTLYKAGYGSLGTVNGGLGVDKVTIKGTAITAVLANNAASTTTVSGTLDAAGSIDNIQVTAGTSTGWTWDDLKVSVPV